MPLIHNQVEFVGDETDILSQVARTEETIARASV